MSVGDLTLPERMQTDDGPMWARESEFVVNTLKYALAQALAIVVRVQHDLCLNRNTLLEILRRLAWNKVAYATQLVAAADGVRSTDTDPRRVEFNVQRRARGGRWRGGLGHTGRRRLV